MYGLDRFVAAPPLSGLLSILLLAGCDGLGQLVLRVFDVAIDDEHRWPRWQAPVVGAMPLAVVLYPLALAHLTPLWFMRAVASALAVVGIVDVVQLARMLWSQWERSGLRTTSRNLKGWHLVLAVTLVAAGLMALGPVTDADSLDYHMGVPMALLRSGGIPVTPEWFHSRIAGSNEVLNALGLAVGSESFGACMQFAGLVGIVGLLLFAECADGDDADGRRTRTIAAAAALSAPALVGLISQKPQLMPVALTTLALALVVYPSRRSLSPGAARRGHALVCLLVMSASQAKLPYLLGGGVVGLVSLFAMTKRGLLAPAIVISIVAAAVVLGPPVLWKHRIFHDSVVNSLIKPAPGYLPGIDRFEKYLRSFRDSVEPFPLSLIVPSGVATLTTIIGPAGFLLLVALRPDGDIWRWSAIGAAVLVLLGLILLAPPTSRSFLEPYFWLLMVLALQADRGPIRSPLLTMPVAAQAVLACVMFGFAAATLFPGSLTPAWRARVMERSANGYVAMKWADAVLPPDAVMISELRSMALAPRDAVSLDWTRVIDVGSPESAFYLQRLKDRHVTHMLAFGAQPNFAGLDRCVGRLVAGPTESTTAYRNPFSDVPHFPTWVYAFHSESLPDCAIAGPHPKR